VADVRIVGVSATAGGAEGVTVRSPARRRRSRWVPAADLLHE